MTVHSPQTTAHGEVIEIPSQVASAQDGAVEAVPAYFTPDTLIDDLMDELAEAKERIAFLTAANRELSEGVTALQSAIVTVFGNKPVQRPEHRLVSAAREALAMVKSGGGKP